MVERALLPRFVFLSVPAVAFADLIERLYRWAEWRRRPPTSAQLAMLERMGLPDAKAHDSAEGTEPIHRYTSGQVCLRAAVIIIRLTEANSAGGIDTVSHLSHIILILMSYLSRTAMKHGAKVSAVCQLPSQLLNSGLGTRCETRKTCNQRGEHQE